MNSSLFSFERTAIRILYKCGVSGFVAKDVCAAFGDSGHKRSVSRLGEDEREMVQGTDSIGRQQMATGVNESGLYPLLFMLQPEMAGRNGKEAV